MGLLSGGFNLASSIVSGTAQGAGGLLRASGSMLLGGLASLLRAGFGQIFGVLSNLVMGTVKMVTGLPRAILSGLARLSDTVIGALGNTARAISGLLGGALKLGLGALAGAVGGLVVGLSRAVQLTTNFGRAVNSLAGSTGLSVGAAGRLQSQYAGVGVDAGALFGGQNPSAFKMRASVYGLSGFDDPRFASQLAGKYQSMMQGGMVSQTQARQMLGALGLDNEQGQKLANTRASDLRENERFTTRTQNAFGIDTSKISGITRDFDALTGKVKTLGTTVAYAVAQKLLPSLNGFADNALGMAERFWAARRA